MKLGKDGCTWGDLLLYNFRYTSEAGTHAEGIPAKAIQVIPPGGGIAFGLDFSASWGVGRGDSLKSTIVYEVLVQNKKNMTGVTLSMNGYDFENDGMVDVWELSPDPLVHLHVYADRDGTKDSDTTKFEKLDFGQVDLEIKLTGNRGSASVAKVSTGFSLQ